MTEGKELMPQGDAGDAVDWACDHIHDASDAMDFLEEWRSFTHGRPLPADYLQWVAFQHKCAADAKASRTLSDSGDDVVADGSVALALFGADMLDLQAKTSQSVADSVPAICAEERWEQHRAVYEAEAAEKRRSAEAIRKVVAAMPSTPEIVEALDDLQQAEFEYRLMHDRHGDGSRAAGRAWDLMRRAGDKARAALNRDRG